MTETRGRRASGKANEKWRRGRAEARSEWKIHSWEREKEQDPGGRRMPLCEARGPVTTAGESRPSGAVPNCSLSLPSRSRARSARFWALTRKLSSPHAHTSYVGRRCELHCHNLSAPVWAASSLLQPYHLFAKDANSFRAALPPPGLRLGTPTKRTWKCRVLLHGS